MMNNINTAVPLLDGLSHLDNLEAESISIIRDITAETENPVMLYSIGKDSSVLLHLAKKAFWPQPIPFPLLHVDTGWKFQEMYHFRDTQIAQQNLKLLIFKNQEGIAQNINPLTHDSSFYTHTMKTQALKHALDYYQFDAAFGGARRDEEKSRAKERILSFRNKAHQWDPKNQRPELWSLFNTCKNKGESFRAFPLSNWTEMDVWLYILREQIPVVPLYFAALRPVIEQAGQLIMVDDQRFLEHTQKRATLKKVRFRTLGCYPLTAAFASEASTVAEIIAEMLTLNTSERQGRLIDSDCSASMEKKKREGYF